MGRTTAARAWEQAGEGAGRWRAPVDDVVLPVAERHGDPDSRSRQVGRRIGLECERGDIRAPLRPATPSGMTDG